MIRILLLSLFLVGNVLAQKTLHVSTIPSHADIYVQQTHPEHADKPDYTSPAFIPISEESALDGEILISLFNPSFSDTTIRVKLSNRDTSYLIVSQRPVLDEALLQEQQSEISKRFRRSFGHKMMFASAVPLLVGAVSGAITYYEINQAKESKKKMENSAIAQGESYRDAESDFKNSRKKARYARYATYSGLITGALLLSIGFILSF